MVERIASSVGTASVQHSDSGSPVEKLALSIVDDLVSACTRAPCRSGRGWSSRTLSDSWPGESRSHLVQISEVGPRAASTDGNFHYMALGASRRGRTERARNASKSALAIAAETGL